MWRNNYDASGDKNIENKNKIPTKIAVKPVLPPASTPAELSTQSVTGEHPKKFQKCLRYYQL